MFASILHFHTHQGDFFLEKEVLLEETFFRNVLVWGEYEYFCERTIHKTQLGLIYLHLYIFLKGLGEYANATCTGVRCPQPRSQPLAPIRSHFVLENYESCALLALTGTQGASGVRVQAE